MHITNTHNLKRNFIKEKVIYKKKNDMRFLRKCCFLVEPIKKKEKNKKDEIIQWVVTFETLFLKWQGFTLT